MSHFQAYFGVRMCIHKAIGGVKFKHTAALEWKDNSAEHFPYSLFMTQRQMGENIQLKLPPFLFQFLWYYPLTYVSTAVLKLSTLWINECKCVHHCVTDARYNTWQADMK